MATRITYRASVSFESDSVPCQTHRTEIVAATARKAASSALAGARQAFKHSKPRSIVIVLEEISRGTVPGKRRGGL